MFSTALKVTAPGSLYALNRTTNLPTMTAFTMMCWFRRLSTAASDDNILSIGNSASAFYSAMTNGTPAWFLWENVLGTTGATLVNEVWYHVAMICEGTGTSQLRLYVNGRLTINETGALTGAATTMSVGGHTAGGNVADMVIGAVKIWDKPLSVDGIVTEMRQVAPVDWAQLNAFSPVGGPGWELDYSGRGRHWTKATSGVVLTGGPPVPWIAQPTSRRVKAAAAGPAGTAHYRSARMLMGVGR